MYRLAGFAALESIADVSVTFFDANLHDIDVNDEEDTAQFTPSTDTCIFVLSFEKPVPVTVISWPVGEPEFVLIDVMAGMTVN